MDQGTQQNAAMVNRSADASRDLVAQADSLAGLVGRFKVDAHSASQRRVA
jgi:methyl-accepting chemotaxis protein